MQDIRSDSLRIYLVSDDFAQSHSGLDCMFVSIRLGTGPGDLPESLDNPAFFHGGTRSGF
jgi:hypothetical protein